MNALATALQRIGAAGLTLVLLTGCQSTDGGGGTQVGADVYYGHDFYDPWYYGPAHYPPDTIVVPPPKPTHPIAPAPPSAPRPTPMPSIPHMPMPRVGVR